jgi:hypothetical protein
MNQSINESINQSIEQSNNRSINRSIDQSINQSINQSIERNELLFLFLFYVLAPSESELFVSKEEEEEEGILLWSGGHLYPQRRTTMDDGRCSFAGFGFVAFVFDFVALCVVRACVNLRVRM